MLLKHNQVIRLHKQLHIKDQLIEFLQLQLLETKSTMLPMPIEKMVEAASDTSDLLEMVDVPCKTNDLMVENYMIDDSFSNHEKELMNTSFEDESPTEAQNDRAAVNVNLRNNIIKGIIQYNVIFPR